ncbi:DeoR/GlpR family DNA-binding transcription regulator [Phenylobacterium sp. LjRoot219]|uniref:DeoR/GlpR family DNA-binding transcription regulator n=1 Tax=Phenylobacterium sp. LjRoot219 TaxID=3342283 RepID=UPI003ED14F7E
MHANERERLIFEMMQSRGFVSFQELDARLDASPATIRRDLDRLEQEGRLQRVRGGARMPGEDERSGGPAQGHLSGVPFHENISRHPHEKAAIGRAAAELCRHGEAVMIDGGSTTLQMCPHLAGLNLQVLTNSLHIVSALLPQTGTRILVPSGTVFREQNIILSAAGEDSMPRFHAPRLFMGAAAIGPQGIMQADVVLVAAERRLIERADEIIVLVDSSKFSGPSGHLVCDLDEIDVVVTDPGISDAGREMLAAADVKLIIA